MSEDLTAKIRAAFAPCRLGRWPTPLARAGPLGHALGLDALWIKHESASAEAYGGSKVRGLEFLFAGAPADAVFVTIGGTGSTHCLATAVHARAIGRRAVLAQFPQPTTAAAGALARAASVAADAVVRSGTRVAFPLAVLEAWRRARTLGAATWIPGGGAHPRAVLGHLVAGLELATQLPDAPDAIVTPLGSAGTAAGLTLAMRALRWPTAVVGVRVAPLVLANRWRAARLAAGAERLIRGAGSRIPAAPRCGELAVLNGMGRGYGHPTRAGGAAMELAGRHGVVLDPTYTAKAFAAISLLARRGYRQVVFWHTFAIPPDLPGALP